MKILKSKKGIALENTLLFMMIIFSLCFLISSFTLMGHYQGEIEKTMITNRVELDQIGENFVVNRETLVDNYDDYDFVATSNTLTVWHKNNSGNILLYVEVNGDGDILIWRYS